MVECFARVPITLGAGAWHQAQLPATWTLKGAWQPRKPLCKHADAADCPSGVRFALWACSYSNAALRPSLSVLFVRPARAWLWPGCVQCSSDEDARTVENWAFACRPRRRSWRARRWASQAAAGTGTAQQLEEGKAVCTSKRPQTCLARQHLVLDYLPVSCGRAVAAVRGCKEAMSVLALQEEFTELVEVDGRRRRRFVLHRAGGVTTEADALSREDQAGTAVDGLRGAYTCLLGCLFVLQGCPVKVVGILSKCSQLPCTALLWPVRGIGCSFSDCGLFGL